MISQRGKWQWGAWSKMRERGPARHAASSGFAAAAWTTSPSTVCSTSPADGWTLTKQLKIWNLAEHDYDFATRQVAVGRMVENARERTSTSRCLQRLRGRRSTVRALHVGRLNGSHHSRGYGCTGARY